MNVCQNSLQDLQNNPWIVQILAMISCDFNVLRTVLGGILFLVVLLKWMFSWSDTKEILTAIFNTKKG